MKTVFQGHFVQRNLIFAGLGESYLIGRVHRDAQGASKTGYYVWKPDSHPLWRGVSASSFLTRIGLKNAIATEIRFIQRNNRYTVGELLLAILYPIILGLERIETTQLLKHNGVFRYLSGLSAYTYIRPFTRFFLRITTHVYP